MRFTVVVTIVALALMGLVQARTGVLERWDIQPGILSKFMKDPGHEKITNLARGLAGINKDLLLEKPLRSGVEYNDMPGKDGDTTNLIDFLVKFFMAEKDTEAEQRDLLVKFVNEDPNAKRLICKAVDGPDCNRKQVVIKMANSNVEKAKAMLRLWFCNKDSRQDDQFCVAMTKVLFKYEKRKMTEVAASHVGCKQTWHAMCPVASSPRGDWFIFTQNDLKKLIKNQFIAWWDEALVMQNKFLSHPNSKNPDMDDSDFPIAHILHTTQDSFAGGHAVRDAHGKGGCGPIHLFQGYTQQHGNDKHGASDHDPVPNNLIMDPRSAFNAKRRDAMFQCAVRHSSHFLEKWATCKKYARSITPKKVNATGVCAFPEKVFEAAFTIAEGRGEAQAGGSVLRYSSFYAPTAQEIDAKIKLEQYAVRKYTLPIYTGKEIFEDCTRPTNAEGICEMDVYDLHYHVKPKDPREINTKPVARGAIFSEYIKKMPGKDHYTNDFVCKQLVPIEQLD